jgi:hypothetical protein
LDAGKEENLTLALEGDCFSNWSEEQHCWQVKAGKYAIVLSNDASLQPESILDSKSIKITKDWSWNGISPT